MQEKIHQQIAKVRGLFHSCSVQFESFDSKIVEVLGIESIDDYGFIIDSFYLFEDTELAKEYVRLNGFSKLGETSNIGLTYLKFYGLMNACYMQSEALLVCAKKLGVKLDTVAIKGSGIIQYRNDFAAHSANRGRDDGAHSFILDRFGLTEGRVSGYSSNAPGGVSFRNQKVSTLVSEWDKLFYECLRKISDEIGTRFPDA